MASVNMVTAASESSAIPVAMTTCTGATPMINSATRSHCAAGANRPRTDNAERSPSACYAAAAAKRSSACSKRAVRRRPPTALPDAAAPPLPPASPSPPPPIAEPAPPPPPVAAPPPAAPPPPAAAPPPVAPPPTAPVPPPGPAASARGGTNKHAATNVTASLCDMAFFLIPPLPFERIADEVGSCAKMIHDPR